MADAIKLTRFGGIAPRYATELLPDGFGQVTMNCKLTSGDLVPYRESRYIMDSPVASPLTIYPIIVDYEFFWMYWTTDVDVARSPVSEQSSQRFYLTGDGVPKTTDINRATFHQTATKTAGYAVVVGDYEKTIRFTTAGVTCDLLAAATARNQFVVLVKNNAGSGDVTIDPNGAETIDGVATIAIPPGEKRLLRCNGTLWTSSVPVGYPYDTFDLGLPAPSGACTINFDINAQAAAYTVVAGDNGKTIDCSATPWTLGLTTAPTLGASFVCVVRNLGTADLTTDPAGSELINNSTTLVIKSGEVGVVVCNGTSFTGTLLSATFKGYVYTYVSEWGEESAPSPVSNLLLHTSKQRVLVTGLPSAAPAGDYNVRTYRLYRTNTSSTGTAYQFVVEQNIGTTTYNDVLEDTGLGEIIASTFYTKPPTDLKGIVNMANGITAGFSGNSVYFSEPYEPHAWPAAYVQSVDFEIVAIGAIGNSLVITTEGRPYVATGNHPSSITVYPLDLPYPCLSKRGLVNMGTGIMYPSFEGLVFVSGSAPSLASVQLFTRLEWKDYNPTTMTAKFYDGKYFANYVDDFGTPRSFIFQNAQDRLALLVTTNIWGAASYSDPETGQLFFVQTDRLYQWDDDDEPYSQADWQSKNFVFKKPVNFGAAKIYASYPATADSSLQIAAIQAANAALMAGDPYGYLGDDEMAEEVDFAGDLLEPLPNDLAATVVLFQLFADKVLKWQRYVADSKPFRLPTGFKTDTYSVRIAAAFPIHAVLVAETPIALEQLDAA